MEKEIKPGEQVYKHFSDFRCNDFVELFCEFSYALELSQNESNQAFKNRRLDFLDEEVNELIEATNNHDVVEQVDGAADVAFVAITQIYHIFREAGFDHFQARVKTRQALWEVGQTNIVKNTPTGPFEKITKPEGWEPPKIADLFLTTEELFEKRKKEKDGGGEQT